MSSDHPDAQRVVSLLEALVAEQRTAAARQSEALANHARAIAVQAALTRQALRWFCTFILAFGAVAALTNAWPSLAWLLEGG